jgi:putative adhesin
MVKLATTAAVFLAALSIAPTRMSAPALFAQSTGSPTEKDFVSGGKIEITLESGDYHIRASADNRIHVRWNEASAKGVRVKLTTNGKSAELRVENTPHNNFHATIEVPALTDARVRLTAGNLEMAGIKGDKDIEANAGNLNIAVGSSSDWDEVDASVTAGDLHAPAFQTASGGLFRSFKWKGPGKYRLHVHLTAGDINLLK